MPVKLTVKLCRDAKSDGRERILFDSEQRGLGLRLHRSGAKSWCYQWSHGGRVQKVGLGSYEELTLDKARKAAAAKRDAVRLGRDPAGERREARTAWTVREAWEDFQDSIEGKRRKSTLREYRMMLKHHVGPALGSRPIASVTWADLGALHRRIGAKAPVQANRLLKCAARVFDRAQMLEQYPAELRNPARKHDRFPEREDRGRKLEDDELGKLGAHLLAENSPQAQAILVAMLTGCRPGEVAGAAWEDLSEDGRVLRLPKTKTKARAVPLGERPSAILAAQPKIGPWIFPNRTGKGPYANLNYQWRKAREVAKLKAGTRLYDAVRHTFVSIGHERCNLPRWRVALLVGHVTGDRSQTTRYTHLSDRTLLMDADRVSSLLWSLLSGEKAEAQAGAEDESQAAGE